MSRVSARAEITGAILWSRACLVIGTQMLTLADCAMGDRAASVTAVVGMPS